MSSLSPWTFYSMLNKAVKSSMATMAHTTALLKSSFNHFNTDDKNITVPLKMQDVMFCIFFECIPYHFFVKRLKYSNLI